MEPPPTPLFLNSPRADDGGDDGIHAHIRASWFLEAPPSDTMNEPAFYWSYMDRLRQTMPGWSLAPSIWTPTPFDARPRAALLCSGWLCMPEESRVLGMLRLLSADSA